MSVSIKNSITHVILHFGNQGARVAGNKFVSFSAKQVSMNRCLWTQDLRSFLTNANRTSI